MKQIISEYIKAILYRNNKSAARFWEIFQKVMHCQMTAIIFGLDKIISTNILVTVCRSLSKFPVKCLWIPSNKVKIMSRQKFVNFLSKKYWKLSYI